VSVPTDGPVKDVYLHVGLPKTGTTSLQFALEQGREAMLAQGVLFPGGRHHEQRRAAYDLLGRRIPGDDEKVAGAFRSLVREIRDDDNPTVVISEELLGLARPAHVRRLARALRGHRLHVVVTVRDLGRTLLAAWQQEIVMGQTWPWDEYVAAVRDPREGVRAGTAFWLRHDVLRVLDVWGRKVPGDRLHLVTVPPPGAPPGELFDRFCRVVGLRPGTLPTDLPPRNRSLGVTGLEVVRRLNGELDGTLTHRQYLQVVERGIRPGLEQISDRPLRLPVEELTWVRERAEALVEELSRRGHPVEGDLGELLPVATAGPDERRIDDVDEAELLAASQAALTRLARAHGNLFRRYRRAFVEQRGEDPGLLELVGSSTRAAGFRARVAALDAADRNRLLAWAARVYLRRTSGSA
jgi:hypothetical protein